MGYYNNYRNNYGFAPYVSVADRRAKAEKKLRALRKLNPNIRPVVIVGNTLAKSWWGKYWNKNLERYADYANRIGRGRSYVRNSAVLDLQISNKLVRSLVQGSDTKPYSVEIQIANLSDSNWQSLRKSCKGAFDSLSDLLTGNFPKSFQELFFDKESGLFPLPEEIKLSCSCPDSAMMCKHISATLYGVGARLDDDPSLFFTLRAINLDELVLNTISETADALLTKAEKKTKKVLEDMDLSQMFGIELEDGSVAKAKTKKDSKRKVDLKKKVSKKQTKAKTSPIKKNIAKKSKSTSKRKA